MAKHGILLVTGLHTHQEGYAADFAQDPRCTIVALADDPNVDKRRRELNDKMAKQYKVPYLDLDKALARKDVDVVSVCAEPERRGPIAVQCARAGKHLYLDKSLVPSLDEADALVAAVKKAGVYSHMFSFVAQPWAQQARKLIDDKKLGTLRAVHADAFFAKGKNGTAKLGKPRKEEFPPRRHQLIEAKREFDNVGVYLIGMIHFLTGKKFADVFAATGNYFFSEHQQHDVEDFGLASGHLAGGVPVSLAAGRFGWTSHPAAGVHRVLLVGSKRSVLIDANRPRLEVYDGSPPWTPPEPHPQDPMFFWTSTQAEMGTKPKKTWAPAGPPPVSDAGFFLDCIDAGRDSPMSVIQAAHVAEVLIASYKSATTGDVVELPLKR